MSTPPELCIAEAEAKLSQNLHHGSRSGPERRDLLFLSEHP